MTRVAGTAILVVVVAIAASGATPQPALVPPGSQVAYVSGQRLSSLSTEGQAGLSRMQTLQQEKAADLRARQQALEQIRQELGRSGPGEERGRLEQEEARRRQALEQAVAQAQSEIQALQRQLANDLMAKVRPIVQELVSGSDVRVVLQADGPILWAAPGLDLTGAVVERLNAASAGR